MSRVDRILAGLATYSGRDACIRITSYIFLFLYGLLIDLDQKNLRNNSWLVKNLLLFFSIEKLVQVSVSFRVLAKQFATTRIIVRFFDDLPTIHQFYKHYIKTFRTQTDKNKNHIPLKTMNPYVKWVTTINLIFWILYNPFEHLGWLGELKVVDVDHESWYFYTNVAWAGGLFTSVLLNFNVVVLYYMQMENKAKREDDKNYDSSKIISKTQMTQAAMIAFRDFLDWSIAIHFMPDGFLWSGKLHYYQVGLIGVCSSFCRVHTYVINRQ